MDKDKILEMSRQDYRNLNVAELDVIVRAGHIAQAVAVLMCVLISLLFTIVADVVLLSPWIIYFSIHGTRSLVKFIGLRRRSELVLAVLFYALCALAFAGLVARLLGMPL